MHYSGRTGLNLQAGDDDVNVYKASFLVLVGPGKNSVICKMSTYTG